jgi:hypothetical protein
MCVTSRRSKLDMRKSFSPLSGYLRLIDPGRIISKCDILVLAYDSCTPAFWQSTSNPAFNLGLGDNPCTISGVILPG